MTTANAEIDVVTEVLLLNRAARASVEMLAGPLRWCGVSFIELEVLLLVERGVVHPGEVSAWLGVASPTVSHVVSRLRARELLVSKQGPADGRRRPLSVTDRGVQVLRGVRDAVGKQAIGVRGVGPDDRDARRLRAALEKWSRALGAPLPSL